MKEDRHLGISFSPFVHNRKVLLNERIGTVDHPPESRVSRMKFLLCAALVVGATSASQVENNTSFCLRVTWSVLT